MPESGVRESVRPALRKAMPSCAILVSSCDAYQDLWTPFFQLFWRYWSDCPFPVYLGANKAVASDGRVITLHASSEGSWSSNLGSYLQSIDAEYVLLLLEDYFLDAPVKTENVIHCLERLHEMSGSVLRLFPRPGPDKPIADVSLENSIAMGAIDRQAPYRVSTQGAIWKRDDLLCLLDERESAWEFEWNGTERSRTAPYLLLATYKPVLQYRHVVERGKWFWSIARRYRQADIGCDFSARPVMGPVTAMRRSLNRWRKRAMDRMLPPRLRRRK